jgi:hypothetical protein
MSLTTPSLPDLPFYVSLLSKTAHDLTVTSGSSTGSGPGAENEQKSAITERITADFG